MLGEIKKKIEEVYDYSAWHILPVGKLDLKKMSDTKRIFGPEEFDGSWTIVVFNKFADEADVLIAIMGAKGNYAKKDEMKNLVHDQSGRQIGRGTVVKEIDNSVEEIKKAFSKNPSLYVFK